MKKGFVRADCLEDGVELYIPIPPKELMQERKTLVIPFYINNQQIGSPDLQRINIIFEYYPKKKKNAIESKEILVIEIYMQVGLCTYRKLMSIREAVNDFDDKKEFMIGMFYSQFLNHGEIYEVYSDYMAEMGTLAIHVPDIQVEREPMPNEDLMDEFVEVNGE